MFSICGNQNLRDFDQFWSMFSDLKHVLCTDAIIWLLWWLPEAFKFSLVLHFITAAFTASNWCVHIFGVYLVLESHICQYANTGWLYQKIKSCLASAQRNCFEADDSALCSRHFSDSHCPAPSLPGMFVGWENLCFAKWSGKRGKFEWMQIFWEFGGGGLEMDVKGRNWRRETGKDAREGGGEFWVRKCVFRYVLFPARSHKLSSLKAGN